MQGMKKESKLRFRVEGIAKIDSNSIKESNLVVHKDDLIIL